MKEIVKKSKVEGDPLEKALRARVVRASYSRPLLTIGETFGEFFTFPTTVVDASA